MNKTVNNEDIIIKKHILNNMKNSDFEVSTTLLLRTQILWFVVACGRVISFQRFEGKYFLHP
jgi:hypothetical protein